MSQSILDFRLWILDWGEHRYKALLLRRILCLLNWIRNRRWTVAITIPSGLPVTETTPGNYLFQERVGHNPLPQNPDLIRLVSAMLVVHDGQDTAP